MVPTGRLEAFERIVSVIKIYCFQTGDYRDPDTNKSLETYLKQNLLGLDWELWNGLGVDERAAFVYNQDALPDNALSLEQFKLRLKNYKRAGYELFSFWRQAQKTILSKLPISKKRSSSE